ncbi:MAG TPA: hypothetical protein VLA02_17340 [Reyranella sp.]|nr:hypothetical protein [Reyranella sp.]
MLLAAALAAAPAWAQAPTVEPNTKLAFPATLGGATLSRSGSEGGGSSYQYVAPNNMLLTVDVYSTRQRVPNGSSHPTIINQFNDELAVLGQQAGGGLEKPAVSSACTYGPYTFRCIAFNAAGGTSGRVYGKLLLIGYRENFVKILIQWTQKSGQTAVDADKVLNAFVPALMR